MNGVDPTGKRPLILIADDDMMIRVMAAARLEALGFSLIEAENGAEALKAISHVKPELFVLDVMMPEIDGFEVCRKLRTNPEFAHVPVLMVTGLEDADSINRAYETGATDFVTKPINWVVFGHRVRYMWRAAKIGEELRRSESLNKTLLDAMPDLMFHLKEDGAIQNLKLPRGRQGAWSPAELCGKNIDEAFGIDSGERLISKCVAKAIETREVQLCEYQVRSGRTLTSYESRIVAGENEDAIVIVRDITEKKNAEKQILHLAFHDPLTGLLNRNSLKEHLNQALAQAQRHGRCLAVILFDLDRFKRINDTFGHSTGDKLLQGVADRLLSCIRKSDVPARSGPDDLISAVGRLGGDEFLSLLPEIDSARDAGRVARRILESISRPFLIGGEEIFITPSIGISIYPHDGSDPESLLKNADAAMYHAKDQGKNNIQYYNKSLNLAASERLAMENDMRKGIERGDFAIYYQPQVDLRTGDIVGCEALLRWIHPELGHISPAQFIPLAEETGLIVPLGQWVLFEACKQAKAWHAGLPSDVRVSVNLSSYQFRQKDLLEVISEAIESSGIEPTHLELEITESAIMQDTDRAVLTLGALREMQIRIAIDDFGTGYSSLSYLKRFPLNVLKIDQSFIKDITVNSRDAAITTAIIALAGSLGLEVIAEGVETKEHMLLLREKGCDLMQGYYFSRPIPPDDFAKVLRNSNGWSCHLSTANAMRETAVFGVASQIPRRAR
ncbi:MAG: EAL domain-containing protein [Syntrophobacteraceae bacterium]|nr:EAL domain-containing protein [Syntrophobacteraceae bacterium]